MTVCCFVGRHHHHRSGRKSQRGADNASWSVVTLHVLLFLIDWEWPM